MNRRALLGAIPALPLVGAAPATTTTAYYSVPLRWAISENSSALLISELAYVEEDIQGTREWRETSPDLRVAYGVPAEAVAVELLIKNKVLCHTASPWYCDGTLAVSIQKCETTQPGNFNSHNRQSKPAGQAGVTVEFVAYNSVKVQLVNGRFDLFMSRSILNHVKVARDVFLVGYGVS